MQRELAIDRQGTLYEAITWSIEHRDCADATKAQHRDHRRWLLEYFEKELECPADKVPLSAVAYPSVQKYIDDEKSRVMLATVGKRLVTLRMALEDAYRRGLRSDKPDWWPEIVSDSKPGQDLWTYEQYRQGRLAFDPKQRIGIDILFWTGMHQSNVYGMRRSHVNLIDGTWQRFNTKSKVEPAWLPLPKEFRAILEDWFAAAGISSPSLKVAPHWWASPIKPMGRVCARADLPRITQLGLRRSCVSHIFRLASEQNKNPEQTADFVALWLGHKGDPKTSSIIRTHYKRWLPSAILAASPF